MTRPSSRTSAGQHEPGEAALELQLQEAEALRVAVGTFVRHVRARDTMPPGQAAVLGHLAREGDLSITDLAEREGVRHQSMARTVKLLADQQFVAILLDVRDRRRVGVHLRAPGNRRLQQERRQRAGVIAQAAGKALSAEERAVAARIPDILDKISQHVRDAT